MFDRMLCKLTHQKVITLQDIFNLMLITVVPTAYIIFDVWFWKIDYIDTHDPINGSPIIVIVGIAGIMGILIVPLLLSIWGLIIYEWSKSVKVAECPLNKN